MKSCRFSIITPIYVGDDYDKERRLKLFKECVESVANQDFLGSYEHIIVNDGCSVDITFPHNPNTRVVNQANSNRIVAFETGLRESHGEIICFLDSDDRYEPNYLSVVDRVFRENPKYSVINFGNKNVSPDGSTWLRDEFKPKKKKVGHEIFQGGQIVNGTFCFKREVYEELGGFPPLLMENIDCTELNYPQYEGQEEPLIRDLHMTSPYDFSAAAQLEFPELQKFYMVKHPDHPKNLVKEFGNPWGQDFYYFYKITRKYHSLPVHIHPLVVNLKV